MMSARPGRVDHAFITPVAGTCFWCSTWIRADSAAHIPGRTSCFNTTAFMPASAQGHQQYNIVLFVRNACIEKLISMYKILKEVQTNDNKILYVFINDYIRTTLSSHRRRCDWFNKPVSWSEARCQSRRGVNNAGPCLSAYRTLCPHRGPNALIQRGKVTQENSAYSSEKICVTSGHSNAGAEHEMGDIK